MRIAALVLALLVATIWFVVTEPLAGSGPAWGGARADPERLRESVEAMVALGPRHDQAGQQRAADWVRARLAPFQPSLQDYRIGPAAFQNVIVRLGPDTPRSVVVSAHFDARGPFPGADDDASGVAGLLELTRMLAAHRPAIRTELAFYSNEEYGLHGSAAHAASLKTAQAMISLEMIGCFSGTQGYPFGFLRFLYPTHPEFIAVVGRPSDALLTRSVKRALAGAGIEVASINAPIPDAGRSDHRSFWKAGVSAVMVTDTANFRNPRYHTADDTPETLDYARMAQVVDGIAAWVSAVPR